MTSSGPLKGEEGMKACSVQVQAVLFGNRHEALSRSLESIAAACRYERSRSDSPLGDLTVVYGDASPSPVLSDSQVEAIREHYEGILTFRYVFFDENTGFGEGNNRLGRSSDCDFLLVVNPDLIFTAPFFGVHLSPFLESGREVGVVEARQTPVEHPKEYDLETGETDWASGACMMVRTSDFIELGGFDTHSFFMYCEDVDLSWRMRMLGKVIVYQPVAPVFHPKRLTRSAHLPQSGAEKRYSAEANLVLAFKWSNMPRVRLLSEAYGKSGDEELMAGLVRFEERRRAGDLPQPIDPEHRASTFRPNGEYAEHRYGL